MQSLVVKGTPRNGFSFASCASLIVPDLMKSSAALASCLASWYLSATKQFSKGLISVIRSMKEFKTSSLVTCKFNNNIVVILYTQLDFF